MSKLSPAFRELGSASSQPRNRRQQAAPASSGPSYPLLHLRERSGLLRPPSWCGWATEEFLHKLSELSLVWALVVLLMEALNSVIYSEWADASIYWSHFRAISSSLVRVQQVYFFWKIKPSQTWPKINSDRHFWSLPKDACKHLIYNNKFWLNWKATSSVSEEKVWN